MRRILFMGCPAKFSDEPESRASRDEIIERGNQKSYTDHPEVARKTLNKKDRHNHLLPLPEWIIRCSPYCRTTLQGILLEAG